MTNHEKFSEEKLDQLASHILLGGSILAVVLILFGITLLIIHPETMKTPLIGESISKAVGSAVRFQGSGIVNLGVLIFMVTPVLRVIAGVIGFSVLRWWRFTMISLVVLAMLCISIFVAS